MEGANQEFMPLQMDIVQPLDICILMLTRISEFGVHGFVLFLNELVVTLAILYFTSIDI